MAGNSARFHILDFTGRRAADLIERGRVLRIK